MSVITVKRAYLELEREGVIVTQQGKGSIVAPNPDLSPRLYDEELSEHLEQVCGSAICSASARRDCHSALSEAC